MANAGFNSSFYLAFFAAPVFSSLTLILFIRFSGQNVKNEGKFFFDHEYINHRSIVSSCSALVASQYSNSPTYLCAFWSFTESRTNFVLSIWLNGDDGDDDNDEASFFFASIVDALQVNQQTVMQKVSTVACYGFCARDDELHNWLQIWIITLQCSIIHSTFFTFFGCKISKSFVVSVLSEIFFCIHFFVCVPLFQFFLSCCSFIFFHSILFSLEYMKWRLQTSTPF